ncbi:MAG: TonB family protein [Myxococcales bacterium]|nr:TonB family protein [Myxococcales bacterium]
MAQHNDRKILRVGIVQNGKIMEERLLRKREPVTIGQSPRNTFVLPTTQFAKGFTLFDVKGGVYQMHFLASMDGRVSVEDNTLDLKALVTRKLADQKGDEYALTLSEKSRGKLVIGDVTFLFQFVTPPPPPSKLQLPASVRGSWFKSLDWFYTAILIGSFVIQVGSVGYVVSREFPEEPKGIEQLPDRFVELLTKPKPKREVAKEPEKKDEGKATEAKEEAVKEVEKPPRPRTPESVAKAPDPEAAAKRAAELQKEVSNKTILKFFGTKGGDGATSIVDTLKGSSTDVSIANAFNGASGVVVADAKTAERDRRRAGSGDTAGQAAGLSDADLQGKAAGGVDSGQKREVEVKGTVKATAPSEAFGTGVLDNNKISETVKRRMGAVKSCYERELKANPTLQGKVVMQFTIEESGRVATVDVKQHTMGDPAVGQCMKNAIAKWRFDRPEGGSVTVSFPFIFAPAN